MFPHVTLIDWDLFDFDFTFDWQIIIINYSLFIFYLLCVMYIHVYWSLPLLRTTIT